MRNIIFALPVLAIGCGIAKDTPLNELTADQWELICGRAITGDETDRTVDCGDPIGEITITASTEATCQAFGGTLVATDCAGTLQDWIDCQDEPDLTDGQICGSEEYTPSAACTAMASCVETATE